MADPMRIRAQLRDGGITEVRVLMAHITGNRPAQGQRLAPLSGAPHSERHCDLERQRRCCRRSSAQRSRRTRC